MDDLQMNLHNQWLTAMPGYSGPDSYVVRLDDNN